MATHIFRELCQQRTSLGFNLTFDMSRKCITMDRLPALTVVSPSHETLLRDWLEKTVPGDMDLTVVRLPQVCETATFYEAGWKVAMTQKVQLILRFCEQHWGKCFLYTDADVQFFCNSLRERLTGQLGEHQIAFQLDSLVNRVYCAGFFIAKATDGVRTLFQQTLRTLQRHDIRGDQRALNESLRARPGLDVTVLDPEQFWSCREPWSLGDPVSPPPQILMHHANWTTGVASKVSLLQAVRREWGKAKQDMDAA